MFQFLLYVFAFFNASFNEQVKLTTIVQTDEGPVQGHIKDTYFKGVSYAAFQGIPYAEAPTGYLRFKPPVEKSPWKEPFLATKEGSPCFQYNVLQKKTVGSEDCLFINVYTPKIEFESVEADLPVMAWIHGGYFKIGDSNSSQYGPDYLLEENVVVVSFQYRLGPLGFLNINHDNATGNAGLKDQNLAMKWIKKNIAKFGGNPNRVTIFGQSAGGTSVSLHTLSEMSANLFQGAITMSGPPLASWSVSKLQNAENRAIELAKKLGAKSNDKDELLEALYTASGYDVIEASKEFVELVPFGPSVENPSLDKNNDKFLTKCPLEKYQSGNYSKVPQIIGYNSEELLGVFGPLHVGFKEVMEAKGMDVDLFRMISLVTKTNKYTSREHIPLLIQDLSNQHFVIGSDLTQKMLSLPHNPDPVYYYKFSFYNKVSAYSNDETLPDELKGYHGVGHRDHIPYLFHYPKINLPFEEPEVDLTRRRLVRMWTNFAKFGNPTPKKELDPLLGTFWIDSRMHGDHLEISDSLKMKPRPIDQSIMVAEEQILKNSALIGC